MATPLGRLFLTLNLTTILVCCSPVPEDAVPSSIRSTHPTDEAPTGPPRVLAFEDDPAPTRSTTIPPLKAPGQYEKGRDALFEPDNKTSIPTSVTTAVPTGGASESSPALPTVSVQTTTSVSATSATSEPTDSPSAASTTQPATSTTTWESTTVAPKPTDNDVPATSPTIPSTTTSQIAYIQVDFDGEMSSQSVLTRSHLEEVFGQPMRYASNVSSLRIEDGSLVQTYTPTSTGSPVTEFPTESLGANDELWLSYDIYFEPGFQWVLGGKLPGLAGGSIPTGGNGADGTDGFSARIMWRSGGRLVVYAYHPDRPGKYGEDLQISGEVETGRWYRIVQRVAMNTNGKADGVVEVWIDGQLRLSETGLRWSTTGSFSVDAFIYSSFYGGHAPEWAPDHPTAARFDNFIVAPTRPINFERS